MTDDKLLLLHKNTWNYLILCKQMNSRLFKDVIYKMCLESIYLIYMH